MKKVFTILAIMIVAACAVFAETAPAKDAAETHKLTVSSTVDVVVPGFSFSVGADSKMIMTNNEQTGDAGVAAAFGTKADGYAKATFDTAMDISKEAVKATFSIWSNRVCNINQSFEFDVAASAFKHGEDPATKATQKSVEFKATTKDTRSDNISVDVADGKLTAKYAGRQSSTSVLLGTVEVVWNQDTAAIPQIYTSDVTLTVTAK